MNDNILFKIIRCLRKPYTKEITHYSDGLISENPDNPTPLTRKTVVKEIYLKERSQ